MATTTVGSTLNIKLSDDSVRSYQLAYQPFFVTGDMVSDGKGGTAMWNLEMSSPSRLVPAGWRSSTVKPGDKVKAVARPMADGTPGGLFVSITLPSGQELTQQAPKAGQAPATP